MPKIDFNDFQKEEEELKRYTVSKIETRDTQYLIQEEDIIFDVIDLDFNGEGPGMEIWISFVGEDFKIRCDLVPKKEFDTLEISDYFLGLIEDYKPCLECKTKFLDGLCHGEDDDNEKA